MEQYIKRLLGHKVKDRVTGFEGTVTSVSFDLFGCVQCIVTPEHNKKEGKTPDSYWFDEKRVEVLSKDPVMSIPAFTLNIERSFATPPGPASKPPLPSKPR